MKTFRLILLLGVAALLGGCSHQPRIELLSICGNEFLFGEDKAFAVTDPSPCTGTRDQFLDRPEAGTPDGD